MSGTRTRLRLRVVPGASRTGIVGRHGPAWKVRVSAPPDAGRANDAVLELLAHVLGVRRRDVELESGAAARDKIVSLDGITAEDTEVRLEAAVGRSR